MPQSDHPPLAPAANAHIPLCVDLDDTLIRTDILWESLVQLWRHPLLALRAFLALVLQGKAAMKLVLASGVAIDPAALPYRQDVLAFIATEKALGRKIVLATATCRQVAEDIADHLGVFDRVFATEAGCNLSGARKRDALKAAYGERAFDYIGDSPKDLPIFAAACQSLLVNPSPALRKAAEQIGNVAKIFSEPGITLKVLVRAMRMHQWAKYALLAVPLLGAHLLFDAQTWIAVAIAFLGFGMVASATYLINDLVDLHADRLHTQKCFRPLASGRLPIQTGIGLAVGLGAAGFGLSAMLLPPGFVAYLALYIVLTLSYSFYLKRRLLVDVLTLAMLYTLRILAGGTAIGVAVTEWLLMFSLFFFLSLAFLKRAIEIQGKGDGSRITGRGYSSADAETIRSIGVSAGLVSVLVLSLYISSPTVTRLYASPQLLWLVGPLLIYWIARIWFLAARGEVHHDPVVFALFDWRSYIVMACGLLIFSVATLGVPTIIW